MFKLVKPVCAQSVWTGKCVSTIDADVATIQGFECLFVNLLSILTTVAGLAFFIMFVVGGFKIIFSGGDPKTAASARSTITSALIGLIVCIVAWLILNFIETFTGVPVTQFEIPS